MTTKQWEIGCYGDGTFGHQHTREACATVIAEALAQGMCLSTGAAISDPNARATGFDAADAVHKDAYNPETCCDIDYASEDAACDWLNEHAHVAGATWSWQDGDFGLWPNEEE